VKPGKELLPGQIYESNSYMIAAALESFGYDDYVVQTVRDDYEQTRDLIKTAVSESELVILTGGISVGEYDFVGKALQEIGTKELFYKINQKPGKPIYMGKVKDTLIAALPGNPAAALTCFFIYVFPSLNQMFGKKFKGLKKSQFPLDISYNKKGNRAVFLKATVDKERVRILDAQSSAMLRTFAAANALAYIPAELSVIEAGELITVYHLI